MGKSVPMNSTKKIFRWSPELMGIGFFNKLGNATHSAQ